MISYLKQGFPHVLPVGRQNITAVGDTITPTGTLMVLTASAGAKTMTSTPTIPPGVDGQLLIIQSQHSSGIALQDQNTLGSSGLSLNAASIALGTNDCLALIWSEDASAWCQIAYQGNTLG